MVTPSSSSTSASTTSSGRGSSSGAQRLGAFGAVYTMPLAPHTHIPHQLHPTATLVWPPPSPAYLFDAAPSDFIGASDIYREVLEQMLGVHATGTCLPYIDDDRGIGGLARLQEF